MTSLLLWKDLGVSRESIEEPDRGIGPYCGGRSCIFISMLGRELMYIQSHERVGTIGKAEAAGAVNRAFPRSGWTLIPLSYARAAANQSKRLECYLHSTTWPHQYLGHLFLHFGMKIAVAAPLTKATTYVTVRPLNVDPHQPLRQSDRPACVHRIRHDND